MLSFRLNVFYTVAKRLSFTKAAAELYVTQPAVTKHIQELENHFGTALFDRRGNQISLTTAGNLLLRHAETLMATYRQLEFDMNGLKGKSGGTLRVGASMTVAQYVIPPVLARFHEQSSDVSISLLSGNTELIEQQLLNDEIDLGLVEGRTHHSDIRYTPFLKDELVLVCRADHPLADRDELTLEELCQVPMVLRERGSGSQEVVEHALRRLGVRLTDLTVEMQLGSPESIKSYVSNSKGMGFISLFAVQQEVQAGTLKILDIAGLTIERDLYSIRLQGVSEGLSETFMRFARQHYKR